MSTRAFIAARWYTESSGRTVDLLVVHTPETAEKPHVARAVAHDFATRDGSNKASTHCVGDDAEAIDCVHDKDVAFAAPGGNHQGWHFELAGHAAQSAADWEDDYSAKAIAVAAPVFAEKAKKFGLPIRWVTVEDLVAGGARARGITSHWNISRAFHRSTHTDPGEHFPADHFLELVRHHAGGHTPMPVDDGPWIWVELNTPQDHFWTDFLPVSQLAATHRIQRLAAPAAQHPPASFGDPTGLSYVRIPNWPSRLGRNRVETLGNMLEDAGLAH